MDAINLILFAVLFVLQVAILILLLRRRSGDAGHQTELLARQLQAQDNERRAQIERLEAAVQTLSLALDPFPRHPDATRILAEKGVINEEQAALVRRIYAMSINGKTVSAIAKALTADHVPTPGGQAMYCCNSLSGAW